MYVMTDDIYLGVLLEAEVTCYRRTPILMCVDVTFKCQQFHPASVR